MFSIHLCDIKKEEMGLSMREWWVKHEKMPEEHRGEQYFSVCARACASMSVGVVCVWFCVCVCVCCNALDAKWKRIEVFSARRQGKEWKMIYSVSRKQIKCKLTLNRQAREIKVVCIHIFDITLLAMRNVRERQREISKKKQREGRRGYEQ